MKMAVIVRFGVCALVLALHGCGRDDDKVDGNVSVSEPWPVKGKLVGPDKGDGEQKKSRDISGIACDREAGFPRRCLVIDDEGQAAQAVTVEDGRLVVGGVVPLITDSFEGKPLELDGEGVGFSDGAFYVMGSHGHPRDRKHKLDESGDAAEIAAKIKASSHVARVRLGHSAWGDDDGEVQGADVATSVRLREALQSLDPLKPYVDRRLDQDGLTIEGVAVARGLFYAGLRSPVLDGTSALVVEADAAQLFGQGPLNAKLVRLNLNGRGIRDLAVSGSSLLILAGPAPDEAGASAVYQWDGTGEARLLGELPAPEEEEKPEAILPLDQSGSTVRLLVLYDGAKEGGPRAVTLRK